ncbi:DUF805 domain-containing protein [Paenibacillus tianjinensis]|uniref:DUF805 domain-containing protein n=1 Tax=Paenibacillus tianjinensis TaxID=2810347 RepID=A0ABX7L7V8_9BACL|nr:DUF805 domain-containing protein [Paenibacillus tianjinensis]QSF44295.1 DUF805 domain-containing protein [Paenibacillus tianjinensis]
MDWYLKVVKNYAVFSGRARRKEFWMFVLVNFLIGILFGIAEDFFGVSTLISKLYSLFILIPSLAVLARRLHDIGRTGWWILISFIPFVGFIVLFILACIDSEGTNKYGLSPKY